jgi:hypothetical protein
LDEIINSQRPCYDKSGLGYKQTHTEKGSSSITTEKEAEQKSYAEVIRGPIKKEECKPSKENIQAMEIIQEEYHPIRGTHEINNQQWRGLKKKITEELHHLEDLPHSGTKLSFLDYVIPATILGTRL